MSKYGKEDVYVTASDGKKVLREMLSEYERILSQQKSLHSPDFLETIQKEEKVSNIEQEDVEVSKISDESTVINYIMLARIYDLLTVIADSLGRGEDVMKIMDLHSQGQLMSPPPTLMSSEDSEDEEA